MLTPDVETRLREWVETGHGDVYPLSDIRDLLEEIDHRRSILNAIGVALENQLERALSVEIQDYLRNFDTLAPYIDSFVQRLINVVTDVIDSAVTAEKGNKDNSGK